MGSAERLVRACLRGGWNKVVKNVEGKAEAVRQESERARARKVIGKEKEGEREGKTDRLREEEREYREPGGGSSQGIAVVWWCVGLCLRNPFRESAERGTQTPEWGKNSVSLPVLHPSPSRPSVHSLAPILSPFLVAFLSSALPVTLLFSLFLHLSISLLPFVSLGSRLRGNQAEHKLGRRLMAGNI